MDIFYIFLISACIIVVYDLIFPTLRAISDLISSKMALTVTRWQADMELYHANIDAQISDLTKDKKKQIGFELDYPGEEDTEEDE